MSETGRREPDGSGSGASDADRREPDGSGSGASDADRREPDGSETDLRGAAAALIVARDGGVLTLTMSRPGRRNALTRELIAGLDDALGAVDHDTNCVVLCGADGTFSSGVDLDAALSGDGPPFPEILTGITATIRNLDVPVIAAIEGPAYGAGLALALAADIRVVAADARLCEAYIRIGRFAGGGDTFWLPQVVGAAQALRMLCSGDAIAGADAVGMGLAEVCVPSGEALVVAQEMAAKIAAAPRAVIRRTKRAVYDMATMSTEDALRWSVELSAEGDSDV